MARKRPRNSAKKNDDSTSTSGPIPGVPQSQDARRVCTVYEVQGIQPLELVMTTTMATPVQNRIEEVVTPE